MQVWILTAGEVSESTEIKGVFATRELGHGAFAELATERNGAYADLRAHFPDLANEPRYGIRDAQVRDDGGLYLEIGVDFIALAPYDVTEQLAIAGG